MKPKKYVSKEEMITLTELQELTDFLLDDGFDGEVSIEDLEVYED